MGNSHDIQSAQPDGVAIATAPVVTIVDFGMGNIASIINMLRKIGAAPTVATEADEIGAADRLVLPGVGAFDSGIRALEERGLLDVLTRKALSERVPVLGICLGMQLLTKGSEEGSLPGLGWIDAEVKRLRVDNGDRPFPLPHMGWNTVDILTRDGGLYAGMEGEVRFYFVHSYGVSCSSQDDVSSTTTYGAEFVSTLHHENLFGTQFHPEKSHRFGMQLLANFIRGT